MENIKIHNGRKAIPYLNRGSFVIVAGTNGKYRSNLLEDVLSEFKKTEKKVEIIKFSIEDELSPEEYKLYNQSLYQPLFHFNHSKQKQNINKVNIIRSKGINVIGLESGLDILAHKIENDQVAPNNRKNMISSWVWHQKASSFPRYDIKIILADKQNNTKYKELINFIKDYEEIYSKVFDEKFNYEIINIEDKNDKKDYNRVKKELFDLLNEKFVERESYFYF